MEVDHDYAQGSMKAYRTVLETALGLGDTWITNIYNMSQVLAGPTHQLRLLPPQARPFRVSERSCRVSFASSSSAVCRPCDPR